MVGEVGFEPHTHSTKAKSEIVLMPSIALCDTELLCNGTLIQEPEPEPRLLERFEDEVIECLRRPSFCLKGVSFFSS
jgi:hypothetical protein